METFTDRQSDIIKQALDLIAELGIEKLTYRNMARKLGITEPAFYRHFSNKTAIMLGILVYFEGVHSELFSRIRSSSADSLGAIEAIFLKHFELFEKHPALALILFPEVIRQNREELGAKVLEMMKTGQENIMAIITDGKRRGEIRDDIDSEQLALMISGTLRLMVTRWRLEGYKGDLQEQGRRFWRVLSRLVQSEDSRREQSSGTLS
jgi:AcrR family transcriptional regulator